MEDIPEKQKKPVKIKQTSKQTKQPIKQFSVPLTGTSWGFGGVTLSADGWGACSSGLGISWTWEKIMDCLTNS